MRGLERSAAFWLRAYPPAWREQRGAEVTALLRDLAADGARRLDARTALGLLRGGIAARCRQTPPLRYYLPYRLFDLRVPAQYREWVRRDICSPGNVRRNLMGRAWLLLLPLYSTAVTQDPRGFLSMWTVFGVMAVAMSLSVRSDAGERRRLQHHARPAPGGPRTLGEFVWVRTSRARIAAEPGSRVLVLLLAAGALAWSAAAVVAPSRTGVVPCPGQGQCFELVAEDRESSTLLVAVLAGALLAGVILAAAVARRLARRLPDRPDQPARHLVGLPPRAGVAIALWTGLIATEALAEATGAWVLSLSAVAAPACLVLLPSAVVLWARATPDTAFVDLRHVAWTGRPVEVDRYDTELVPALVQEAR
ncbi:hypothetical protein [Cellulomonas fengjieae]|uniref:hypothetical protein n=1 Tax=Cellulomonas fengjieae TaxID=2819978 RepID=UPI001AAE97A0|nr:hypothetical protein [Cellulomonas fengjieae]MBO3101973.1 hypothetical protein [Cellulomonas fengjieae]